MIPNGGHILIMQWIGESIGQTQLINQIWKLDPNWIEDVIQTNLGQQLDFHSQNTMQQISTF